MGKLIIIKNLCNKKRTHPILTKEKFNHFLLYFGYFVIFIRDSVQFDNNFLTESKFT